MARGMDWDRARQRDVVARAGPPPRQPRAPSKPTAKQVKYLKLLRARLGVIGRPLPTTRAEASEEIDLLKQGRTEQLPLPPDRILNIERNVQRRLDGQR